MLDLTRNEERTFHSYMGLTCPYREENDPNRHGWGIGQLRANMYNSSSRNFDNRLLLAKLILIYPEHAAMYIPINTSVYREFKPLAELWSYADSFYYQRERKSSAARVSMTRMDLTALYNIGLVAVGGVYTTCVPWRLFQELYSSMRACISEEGRRMDCTVCGMPKIAFKMCHWCKTGAGEKEPKTEKRNSLREAVVRERNPSQDQWLYTSASSTSSMWNPSSIQSNDEEGD